VYLDKESLVLQYVKTKSPELREKIVLHYNPLVAYIARKLSFNKNDAEDLVQVGVIGLLKALERYLPCRETDFSTFVTPNIIGEIKHYFRDQSRMVKVPRKLHETYSKIKTFIRECQRTGHSPTISEIANHLEIDEEIVLESMEAGQSSVVYSLDAPSKIYSSGSSQTGPSLLDKIGEDSNEDMFLNKEVLTQAMQKLDAREKKIIYWKFYLGMSQTEIAHKIGLSQMHISRLLTKSIKILKKQMDHKI
jgi:RNA polymerase sigma-B factor